MPAREGNEDSLSGTKERVGQISARSSQAINSHWPETTTFLNLGSHCVVFHIHRREHQSLTFFIHIASAHAQA